MTDEPPPERSGPSPAICRDCFLWFPQRATVCPRCRSALNVVHPELADLSIAHIDCDAFYAAIEKRDDPSLNDKPVIVGHPDGRGVVTTACYVARFGKFGHRLAQFAQGEDDRAVTRSRPAKSISAETTFRADLRSADHLVDAVRPLCDRVASRLVRSDLGGLTVVLKLKTADFQVLTRNHRLADPTRKAEIILRAAESLIRREADGRAFRLIGIGVTDLQPGEEGDPPDLFQS